METELKEGDDVVLRGKVVEIEDFDLSFSRVVHLEVETSNGKKRVHIMEDACHLLHKVRPGTYEVTARDVAKMMVRAAKESFTYDIMLEAYLGDGLQHPMFNKLRRWVHCRLRELRRKRKQ